MKIPTSKVRTDGFIGIVRISNVGSGDRYVASTYVAFSSKHWLLPTRPRGKIQIIACDKWGDHTKRQNLYVSVHVTLMQFYKETPLTAP
jgi:hypothetical protein